MKIQNRLDFNKKESIHCGMAFFAPFSLNFFLINTIWTPTQGWYLEWAKYLNQGLDPYADFYLPFPPLFVWVNRVFLWTSDPFIAERFFMAIAYSFLSLGLYKLLTRFLSSNIALYSSLLSILIFQLSPTNTISGYYEFAMLLATWGLYFTLSEKSGTRFLGGILIAGSCLTKQNFLPLIFAITLMESFSLQYRNKYEARKYAITLGAISVFFAYTLYLLSNSSFLRFIEIMLQGGGKDPEVLSLLKNILAPALNPSTLYLFCVVLLIVSVVSDRKNKGENDKGLVVVFLVTQMLVLIFNPFSMSSLLERRTSIIVFGIIFLITLLNWKWLNQPVITSKSWLVILTVFLTPFSAFVFNEIVLRTALNQNRFFHYLNGYSSNVSLSISGLLLLTMNAFVLVQLFAFRSTKLRQYIINCLKYDADQPGLFSKLNYVVFGLLAAGLLNAVNGGFDFPANLILGSISIAFFAKYFAQSLMRKVFVIPFVLSILISSIQIGTHNYQWFGWNEVASGHTTSDRSELRVFRNFYLTDPQKNFYQELNSGIVLAEKKLAKSVDSDPKILVFPMQPVVSELSLLTSYRLNCPVMHFDVCPDNEAEKDLQSFKRNPPDLVVLFDLGVDFIDSNEKAWRDEKVSTYRKIQEFFLESGLYSTIKIIHSNSVNLSDVYILSLDIERD